MLLMQANQKILGHLVRKSVDMIMVGPVSEEPHKVSSKWLHGERCDHSTMNFSCVLMPFVFFCHRAVQIYLLV